MAISMSNDLNFFFKALLCVKKYFKANKTFCTILRLWLYSSPLLFPPKTKKEKEKENIYQKS